MPLWPKAGTHNMQQQKNFLQVRGDKFNHVLAPKNNLAQYDQSMCCFKYMWIELYLILHGFFIIPN